MKILFDRRTMPVSTLDKLSSPQNRALVIDVGIWSENLGSQQIDKTTDTNEHGTSR